MSPDTPPPKAAMGGHRNKSDFLTGLSHELRTPVNSILGFASLLLRDREGNLTDRQIEHLEKIRESSAHLLELVNDVQYLARVEAGQIEPSVEGVDLGEVIREEVRRLGGARPREGLIVRTELPDSLAPIQTDRARMAQIVRQILGNAVKFTRKGSVSMRVHLDAETSRPLRIEVQDTGPGIPSDRLDAIFLAFRTVGPEAEAEYTGTGLGLAICRSLARLLGCRIEVESELGKGTTFTVHLPAPDASPAPAG
jgi:signal transduction histidine kinase